MTRREALLGLLWPMWLVPRPPWEPDPMRVVQEPHRVLVTLQARRGRETDSNTVAVAAWDGGPPLTEAEQARAEALGRELLVRWLADRNRG